MSLEDVAFHYLDGELCYYCLTNNNQLKTVPGGFLGRGVAWILNRAGIRTNAQLLSEMVPRLFNALPQDKRTAFKATLNNLSQKIQDVEIKNLYLKILAAIPSETQAAIPPPKMQEDELVQHLDKWKSYLNENPEQEDHRKIRSLTQKVKEQYPQYKRVQDLCDEILGMDVFFPVAEEAIGIVSAPPKIEANPQQLLEKQILHTFGGDQGATKRIVALLSPGLQSAAFDEQKQTLTLLYTDKAQGTLPDTTRTNWGALSGATFTRGDKLVLRLDPSTQSITKQEGIFEGSRARLIFEIEKMSCLSDTSFRIDPKGVSSLARMALATLRDREMTHKDFDAIFKSLIEQWK